LVKAKLAKLLDPSRMRSSRHRDSRVGAERSTLLDYDSRKA
jgi:hypothetical protein